MTIPQNSSVSADLPLAGIRVLELGGYISGPYATSILCSLGADVVKIERPDCGDDFRRGVNDASPYFIQYNAGKQSVAVDLKSEEGVAVVRRLLPRFDVLVENLRPGKLAAVGLGPDDCRAVNPTLIYSSVSGFGEGGPLADRPAYDTIGQAFGGIYSLLSDENNASLSGMIFGDIVTAMSSAMGVLAALVGRGRTTNGQVVQTSILEAMSMLTVDSYTQYFENGRVSPSRESRHPQAQNFCLRTSSGGYIAIHLSSSQKFWANLVAATGRRELSDDPRFRTYPDRLKHYFDLVAIVEPIFLTRSGEEWADILSRFDVPFSPVLSVGEYHDHPQTRWHELVEPERNGVALVRPPWRFDGRRPSRDVAPPRVGEHTRAVVREVLDEASVERLLESGILFADS